MAGVFHVVPLVGDADSSVVTLSGAFIFAADASGGPYDTNVAIRFNPDGTVEEGTSIGGAAITWTQLSPTTDWIIPNGDADPLHEVRYTNRVGTQDFTTKAAAEDTWIDLSLERMWKWNRTTSGTVEFECDFEIRFDGGATLDAGVYNFRIENTT